ncbi:MAG: 30S ribosomal protein S14 [Bacteroidetes bacterium]|nr:30S ribosomal protein S14 [Bacteroidota bacterium]
MLYKKAKDIKYRNLFLKSEKQRVLAKFLRSNEFLEKDLRNYGGYLLYNNKGYSSRVRDLCIYSGRSRFLIKTFKVSRIIFKSLASHGKLPGVRKASW